jgi:hypothetical protein
VVRYRREEDVDVSHGIGRALPNRLYIFVEHVEALVVHVGVLQCSEVVGLAASDAAQHTN